MKKIGLAGFGFIGRFFYNRIAERKDIQVEAVWDMDSTKTADLDPEQVCTDLKDLGSRPLDLIVEVAHPTVVQTLWPNITSGADFMIASMTSMADSNFHAMLMSMRQLPWQGSVFKPLVL